MWWLFCDAREEIRPGNWQEGDLKMSGSKEIVRTQCVSREGQD